jgi:2-polyprenyl-6-methoxyphenol hydroxylase-like FAD-dependent oxidoreductase
VSPAADSAAVVLEDGRRLHADIVVGADGVASAVRRALHPDEAAPRTSGYHAIRGVSHDVGGELGTADSAIYFTRGAEIGFARASTSAVYWYMSVVDGLAAAEPADTIARCARGLDAAALAIIRAARPDDIRGDRLFVRDPLTAWGAGRVTLLGDAAHPVLPHTAQGAALALEDAVALGLALRDGDLERRLRLYERVRATRTRKIVKVGPRIAAMTTTVSPARILLRDVLTRLTPASALSKTLTRHARDPHRALRQREPG